MPSEKGKFIRVTVDLSSDEYRRLHMKAERQGQTHSRVIRMALHRATKDVPAPTPDARSEFSKGQ